MPLSCLSYLDFTLLKGQPIGHPKAYHQVCWNYIEASTCADSFLSLTTKCDNHGSAKSKKDMLKHFETDTQLSLPFLSQTLNFAFTPVYVIPEKETRQISSALDQISMWPSAVRFTGLKSWKSWNQISELLCSADKGNSLIICYHLNWFRRYHKDFPGRKASNSVLQCHSLALANQDHASRYGCRLDCMVPRCGIPIAVQYGNL